MFAFVVIENPEHQYGLAHLGGLANYFACTLVGDLAAICSKGSKAVVVGICPDDHLQKDISEQVSLNGYKIIVISFDELKDWAQAKDGDLWTTICQITVQMENGGWTVESQKALVFHVKHFAQSKGFFRKH